MFSGFSVHIGTTRGTSPPSAQTGPDETGPAGTPLSPSEDQDLIRYAAGGAPLAVTQNFLFVLT